MNRRWWFIVSLLLTLMMSISGGSVSAHANLLQSEPPANAVLPSAPGEIRIWFTEPLEAEFSKIVLRDQNGNIVETQTSHVDPTDPTQIYMIPGPLPDGLYTVAWRALSSADGHATIGSYAIIIGTSRGIINTAPSTADNVPADGTFIRWANLMSLAIGVGGIGFLLFVWKPAIGNTQPAIERRIHIIIWIGWVFIGITGFLVILGQYAQATGTPLLSGINSESLNGLVAGTRFGHLWLARMALWAGLGGALWFARTDEWFLWVALIIGGAILAINSVFSHASAALDLNISVGADWLHLAAMALWVGGLVQFCNVMIPLRKLPKDSTLRLSNLVGHFSNFARVSVAVLTVTGLYSAWLEVGSLDALLTTTYGQLLIIKLVLVIPVIAIAAVNLFYTHRGLAAGQAIWAGRLFSLVCAEIAVTTGILITVGAMTSISPARSSLNLRLANPPPPPLAPIEDTKTANDLTVQLVFSPGWIGDNTFALKVTDSSGQPVNDATLIRMKFESQEQNLGESELRPTLAGDGLYTIEGANLSVPGLWRIRTTIQRPDVFDTLVDFEPTVPAAPEPPEIVPLPSPTEPLPNRDLVLMLTGVLALVTGGFFLGENRAQIMKASTLLAIGLLLLGGLCLLGAVQSQNSATVDASEAIFDPPISSPVRMAVSSNVPQPYLITEDGKLLQPGDDGIWREMSLDAAIKDVYIDTQKTIWAATDMGLFSYQDGSWQQQSTQPSTRLVMTHGYLFALGDGDMVRVPAGPGENDTIRDLKTPLEDTPADELVMLGSHSHVLEEGSKLYHTLDLGLSWKPIDTATPVDEISTDADGNLLMADAQGVHLWSYLTKTWQSTYPLPGGDNHPVLRNFDGRIYAAASGRLYVLAGSQWELISLPDADGAYLVSLEFQYPRTLWTLDASGNRLWSSEDGKKWELTPIVRN